MPTALLSVYDKTGIVEFAEELVEMGWDLFASGGTCRHLKQNGLSVVDIADLVGEPILGHRVVTLSREVHAGLLARVVDPDIADLERIGAPFIDLVCVDLYPLEEAIADPEATHESVIENTDIGGPTMLSSAAKGRRIVISQASQRDEVMQWLKDDCPDEDDYLNYLAAVADAVVAKYRLSSSRYHSGGGFDGFVGRVVRTCKYGENTWQAPAHLLTTDSDDPLALPNFRTIEGDEPSFNNLVDVDRLLQTITHIAAGYEFNFGLPHIAIGAKHGNPCGAAVGFDTTVVMEKMARGDARAMFGGLVMTNFEVGEAEAEVLKEIQGTLDGIIAPSFAPEAIDLLSRKKTQKCRFLVNPSLVQIGTGSLDKATRYRYVRGGFLRQPNYTYLINLGDEDLVVTGEGLSTYNLADLILGWAVGSTSNSNTITLVRNGQLIGNGVGQQDRVSCCELAVKRARDAGHDIESAVAYSDSFFPFPDGPQVLIDAGVKAIWATSGSVRDEEIQSLCLDQGVALYQVPDAKGRGFFGH